MAWRKKLMNSWNSRTRLKCHVNLLNTVLFFFLNDLVPWNRFERWRSEEALPRQGWACLSLEDKGCTVSWGLYRATIITGGYRWESTDEKSSSPGPGRISIDLEDTYQIGTITEFLRCRDFAPPSLFQIYRCKQDWRRKRRICGRSNCFWIFFFGFGDYWKNRSL